MRPPLRSARDLVLASVIAVSLLACGDDKPNRDPAATTAAPSAKVATSSSAPAASAAPTAIASSTAAPSASAAAAFPKVARPKVVTSCDPAPAHFGGFTPSLDDLVAAAAALEADVCIPRKDLEQAIRACAFETGVTELSIFADPGEASGCHVQIQGGAHGEHKWITFLGTFRRGPVFDAGATAVELGSPAHVYVDSLGKHAELCPMTSSTGKLPADLPKGWKELPKDAQDFLCSGVLGDVKAEP